MDVLEAYRQNPGEIDVIADQNALFFLSFLNALGGAVTADISDELGWRREEIQAAVALLTDGRFIGEYGSRGRLVVTSEGRALLDSVGLSKYSEGPNDRGSSNVLLGIAAVAMIAGATLVARTYEGKPKRNVSSLLLGFGVGFGLAAIAAPRTNFSTREWFKGKIDVESGLIQRRASGIVKRAKNLFSESGVVASW